MQEAYSVGIRMLLENDVSPGLAAIGRELDGADRAIAATQGGFRSLQDVARTTMSVARAAVPMPGLARLPAPAIGSVPAVERAARQAPVRAELAAPPRAVGAPPSRPADASGPGRPAPRREVPATAVAPRPVAAILPVVREQRPQAAVAPASAPMVMPARREAGREVAPRAARAMPLSGFAPRLPPVVLAQLGVAPAAAPSPPAPAMPSAGVARMPSLPVARPQAARAVSAPVVLRAPGPAPAMGRDIPAGAMAAPRPAMPEAGPATATPGGGDVFLDGMRVGRWMARELARQAGGPSNGATGFDPRVSAVWPGTLQGG